MEKARNILVEGSRRLGRENWKFYDPAGQLMFINNEHRAQWYIRRNLVKIIGDKEVQFVNPPKFKKKIFDPFLTTPIEKICVVCGADDELQKHHVIPTLYRQFMPEAYKSNNHHDVVIICTDHHEYYERTYSNFFRDELAELHDVPTVNDLIASKTQIYKNHKLIINKANSLLRFNANMDMGKIMKLSSDIKNNTPVLRDHFDDILTEIELKKVIRFHRKALKGLGNELDNYIGIKHAKKIVDKCIEDGSLFQFIVNWRKNFVENMNPKFLPQGWDVFKKMPDEE